MSTIAESRAEEAPRLQTIGAVCRSLQAEFPDLSISKIRYLEDQKLIAPRRTRGGYRLFSEDDVDRLETILRLQRDEFLPLHVIRQELSSPSERRRRRAAASPDRELSPDELCERAGVSAEQLRQIAEFGLLERGRYTEADVEIASLCAQLARYGLEPRRLRTLRTNAGGAADAVVQTAPGLFARNPDKRRDAVEHARSVAELIQDLLQLLFQRELRARLTA